MASPPPAHSPASNASYRSLLESTPLWQALDRLGDHGLSRDAILALSKLEAEDVGKLFDVLETEGRSGVDTLLSPLRGVPEETLRGWVGAVANEKNERGRPRSQSRNRNPPPLVIDNTNYATPALATPLLRPPPPSFRRSSSTRTRSVSSSSTNITHPSVHKKVKVSTKPERKQRHCPDCGKPRKNAFEAHFLEHIDHLFPGAELGDYDVLGCGYCPAHGLLSDQGRVFHGKDDFATHVKDMHASEHRPHWDFNASFNHVLSAQPIFRRKILAKLGPPTDNMFLTPSWVPEPLQRQLLNKLQVVSGQIDNHSFTGDDGKLDDLLDRVYCAASLKLQPLSAYSSFTPVPQRITPAKVPQLSTPQPRSQQPSQDALSFAGIGKAFDTPTPHDPSFAIDTPSPAIVHQPPQPPQPPQQRRTAYEPSNDMEMDMPIRPSHPRSAPALDGPSLIFSFSGNATSFTPPPSHVLKPHIFEDIYKDLNIDASYIYRND